MAGFRKFRLKSYHQKAHDGYAAGWIHEVYADEMDDQYDTPLCYISQVGISAYEDPTFPPPKGPARFDILRPYSRGVTHVRKRYGNEAMLFGSVDEAFAMAKVLWRTGRFKYPDAGTVEKAFK